MAETKKTINTTILLRNDTTANWTTANPVLALGEVGVDTTLNKIKVGDGVTAWNSLDFVSDEDAAITAIESLIGTGFDSTNTVGAAITALDGRLDTLEGAATVAGSVAEAKAAADAAQTDVDAAELEIDALQALHATGKTVAEEVTAGITALDLSNTYAAKSYESKVDTLIGDDANKSARTIAAEETAKIVNGADASYDTLKEIADWIATDITGAATMASNISTNTANITALQGLHATGKTVAEEVTAGITGALKDNDSNDIYAKASDLATANGKITTLEEASHSHSNKAALDQFAAGDKAKLDTALQSVSVNNSSLTPTISNGVNISIATGTDNGTIAVNGTDVAVKGLGAAAYEAKTAFEAAGSVDTAKTAILGESGYAQTVKSAYELATTANTAATSNTSAITTLNSDASTAGSVAKAVKDGNDAIKAIIGGSYTSSATVDAAITAAKKAGDDAAASVSTLSSGAVATNTAAIATLNGDASRTGSVAKAVKDGDDAVKAIIGTEFDSTNTVAAKFAGLAGVATTGKAADVSIADEDGKITATTVEGALAELATSIASSGTAGVVTCAKSTPDGVAARYTFSQGGTAITNAVIDIPKDMVVSSGQVVTNPSGQSNGTYLELTLANATNDKVYINVGDLIEYVTSGSNATDAVVIAVDADHKVTASVTDGTIGLAKLASAVQTKINKAHTHTNSEVLDGITSTQVTNWEAEVGAMAKATINANAINAINDTTTGILKTAKDYADTLDTAMDSRVDALEALLPEEAGAQVNVIESITVGGTAITPSEKVVAIPTATASALGLVKVDDSTIQVSDAGQISVKAISTDLLSQGSLELVLNGGNAGATTV